MQISMKYVFSYLLFKYYTDAVRPLFVTEKFRFMGVNLIYSVLKSYTMRDLR